MSLAVKASLRRVDRILWSVIALFIGTHVLGTYVRVVLGHDTVYGLVPMFSLREGALQTWFASLMLAAAAGLLGLIGADARSGGLRFARHWMALAGIFLFLSADEATQIHEQTVAPLREGLGLSGLQHSAWVIPYTLFAIVLAAAYVPFLRHLTAPVRRLFVLAGLLYVGGAAGMEMLSAPLQESRLLPQALAELVQETLEEIGEMGGVAVLIRALLAHVAEGESRLSIRLGETGLSDSGPGPVSRSA